MPELLTAVVGWVLRVICVALSTDAMVVPARMPVPETTCPTCRPAVVVIVTVLLLVLVVELMDWEVMVMVLPLLPMVVSAALTVS